MKLPILMVITIFSVAMSASLLAFENKNEDKVMSASGIFQVSLEPQKDENAPVGRMIINKEYEGGLVGSGTGQMISKRTESGVAVYSAIEEYKGTVDGKVGAFTLIHNGYMSNDSQSLEIKILEESGIGELKNISGTMDIIQEDGKHKYVLNYEL